jgi:5'-nucleotidase
VDNHTPVRRYTQPLTIFVDQDGPLADFERSARELGLEPKDAKMLKGFYRTLKPVDGALDALQELHSLPGVQVFVATKIPDRNPMAACEKIEWLHELAPYLDERIIITPNKGCLGKVGDIIIDDRAHKADVSFFPGLFIHFGNKTWPSWAEVMVTVREHCRANA